jgi:ATP-dependent RNA helicase DeaD
VFQIRNIERYTNMKIQRGRIPTAGEVEEAKANVFLDKLRTTLKGGEFKRHDHLIERLLEEGFSSTDIASALLHQLQSGEAAPAKAQRQEDYDRPPGSDRPSDRPPFRDARGGDRREERSDRAPRFADRRDDRNSAPPDRQQLRRTERPLMPSSTRPSRDEQRPSQGNRFAAGKDRPANRPQQIPANRAPLSDAKSARRTESVRSEIPKAELPAVVKTAADQTEAPKTYSDAEILSSVPAEGRKPGASKPAFKAKPKASRATPDHQTRIWMNLGEEMGVVPIDVVNAVAGETGLPGKVVGTVDVRERHLFMDVAAEHAHSIIAKLNRSEIKGHKVKVKVA